MEVNLAFAQTTREAYAGVLATFTVNNTGDTDDGNVNNGITTLREAINLANATPGDDTITFGGVFTDTTPDVITLTSGQLTITDDLSILGTGASKLTISGNNASRVFEISGIGTDAIIDGLTVA
ncbi:MAG: CSLREA domain-containing protein, partial [Nostoc sp.]